MKGFRGHSPMSLTKKKTKKIAIAKSLCAIAIFEELVGLSLKNTTPPLNTIFSGTERK